MATELRHTHCVMDCPDVCSLEVGVEAGRVVSIGPGDGHPDTAGFICSKIANFDKRLYHESRLLHPLRRVGPKGEGQFERISWDEAVGEIVEKLGQVREMWGGEAILPFHYGGSNGKALRRADRLPVLCPAGLIASGEDDLRRADDGRGDQDVRQDAGRRLLRLSEGEVHHRLGGQPEGLEYSSPPLPARGQAKGSVHCRGRPAAQLLRR